MMGIYTKTQALKILKKRTGKRFGLGIFSRSLRADRVFCIGTCVLDTAIDVFLRRREAREAEPEELKVSKAFDSMALVICGYAKRLNKLNNHKIEMLGDEIGAIQEIEFHLWCAYRHIQTSAIALRNRLRKAAGTPEPPIPQPESLTPKPEA